MTTPLPSAQPCSLGPFLTQLEKGKKQSPHWGREAKKQWSSSELWPGADPAALTSEHLDA